MAKICLGIIYKYIIILKWNEYVSTFIDSLSFCDVSDYHSLLLALLFTLK